MKKFKMLAVAGLIAIAGAAYAFTPSVQTCPTKGTSSCSATKCTPAGTNTCPKGTNVPACCKK